MPPLASGGDIVNIWLFFETQISPKFYDLQYLIQLSKCFCEYMMSSRSFVAQLAIVQCMKAVCPAGPDMVKLGCTISWKSVFEETPNLALHIPSQSEPYSNTCH